MLMDYFHQDSANITNGFSLNEPAGSTLEDKLTRKRWTRRLLAFYACLLLAGATAIGVSQIMTASSGTEQHASLWNAVRLNHGFVPRP
jgi:hypothetical protein